MAPNQRVSILNMELGKKNVRENLIYHIRVITDCSRLVAAPLRYHVKKFDFFPFLCGNLRAESIFFNSIIGL